MTIELSSKWLAICKNPAQFFPLQQSASEDKDVEKPKSQSTEKAQKSVKGEN